MGYNLVVVLVYRFKTHNCSQLSVTDIGRSVKLSGWVHKKRNHGNLFFMDLRDHSGIVQLVIYNQEMSNNKLKKKDFIAITNISCESVISIYGIVIKRFVKNVNENLPTGKI